MVRAMQCTAVKLIKRLSNLQHVLTSICKRPILNLQNLTMKTQERVQGSPQCRQKGRRMDKAATPFLFEEQCLRIQLQAQMCWILLDL